MAIARMRTATVLLLTQLLAGCGGGELPGYYFEVGLIGTDDECNEPDVSYKDSFIYRVVQTGSAVTIFQDEALLATGVINGCEMVYDTTLYTDQRDDSLVRWRISGSATTAIGGCVDGWEGTERIEITESTDPDVARGCSYTVEVSGDLLYEVQ